MAKTVRIDKVTVLSDGQVTIDFTTGQGPLAASGGSQTVYPNIQALYAAISEYEDQVGDDALMFLALAQWVKGDPQMATPSLARNKTASLDLTGSGTVVRVA